MSISPHLEVIIRNTYWRLTPVVKWVNRQKSAGKTPSPRISSRELIAHLDSLGVKTGDLLIMHSAFSALKGGNETPEEVIRQLMRFLGPEGTLALPSIPYYKDAPDIIQTMKADVSDLVLDYDPLTTPAWTGALPNALCRMQGAIRSLHPLNSMVAMGPLAEPMMDSNLSGDLPLPCGRQSSWYFCYRQNAKVVAVGADLAHSLTMIHVAEDMWDENWLVPDWYRIRKFRVRTGNETLSVSVRERRPKWSMHYAERTLSHDLIKNGITVKQPLNGVNVELLNSRELVDYLNSRNHTAYPYYFVPCKKDLRDVNT
jgi:aminoglycoside 3-N-acetyltransferase